MGCCVFCVGLCVVVFWVVCCIVSVDVVVAGVG